MKQKIIGITTSAWEGQFGLKTYVNDTYISSITRTGAIPLLIPNIDPETASKYVDMIDGILFSGGVDIAPFLYGQDPDMECDKYFLHRDHMEIALYREARKKGIKILGICRGHQLINVACGGDLIQDTRLLKNSTVPHRHKDGARDSEHYCEFNEGSILADVVSSGRHIVNSHHHQFIDNLAKEFKATAHSDDGVIEGYESADKKVLCVQFHPERLTHRPEHLAIFDWLVSDK